MLFKHSHLLLVSSSKSLFPQPLRPRPLRPRPLRPRPLRLLPLQLEPLRLVPRLSGGTTSNAP